MSLPELQSGLAWGQIARTVINNAIRKIKDASATVAGLLEIATDTEAKAKTATDKALVPSNLAALDASDTFAGLVELATAAEATTGTDTERAVTPAGVKAVADAITPIGKHKLWVPAKQMTADASAPPAAATATATNVQYDVLDFDQTTNETAHFNVSMPSSWNEGAITYVPVWTAASGTGDVLWRLQGRAVSNDDVIGGTVAGANSQDTLIAADDLHRGPESGNLAIANTPAANDTVFFSIFRNAAAVSDTLNADARLIGVEIYYTTDAAVDVA